MKTKPQQALSKNRFESAFRKDDGHFLIEFRLESLERFFNPFDPSPITDRDIDDDVERYIVESVRGFPLKAKLKLVFYLPHHQHVQASQVLAGAIDNYFDFKAITASRELQSTLYEGRVALVFGLIFLIVCMTLHTLLSFIDQYTWGTILLEGLNIIGWVAMWRPIHIFLYDWWATARKRKIYEKIRDLPIEMIID